MRPPLRRSQGFTLLEMLAALALLAKMAALAGPLLRPAPAGLRMEDIARKMAGGLRLARAEAIGGNEDRVFIVAAGGESGRDFVAEEDGEQGPELSLRFEYRPATLTDWPEDVRDGKSKPPAQKDLSALAARRVLAVTEAALALWTLEIGRAHV